MSLNSNSYVQRCLCRFYNWPEIIWMITAVKRELFVHLPRCTNDSRTWHSTCSHNTFKQNYSIGSVRQGEEVEQDCTWPSQWACSWQSRGCPGTSPPPDTALLERQLFELFAVISIQSISSVRNNSGGNLCENHEGSTFPQRHHLNLFDRDDDTVLCLIVAITGAACVAA